MSYDAKAVANFFLDLADQALTPLTPMKVQKEVYFAHGWTLALTDKPLVDEPVQAWMWGPVIPSLYHALKVFGNSGISEKIMSSEWDEDKCEVKDIVPIIPPADVQTVAILKKIFEVYGCYSATQLSNLTHQAGTPWAQIAKPYGADIPKGVVIPNEIIRDYFRKMAG